MRRGCIAPKILDARGAQLRRPARPRTHSRAKGRDMYRHIMVPVDLAHEASLAHALEVAADLAKHWGARVTYVGATSSAPGAFSHNPEEYTEKLSAFAARQAETRGVQAEPHAVLVHDLATDLDAALLHTVDELGPDLVVMQSHIPGLKEYIWPSNGGKIAAHAKASVLVVRG